MWFGTKPKTSRAAAMKRQLTEAQLVLQRQKEIRKEIEAFIKKEKDKSDLLADRIQDLVNFQKEQQEKQNQQNNNHTLQQQQQDLTVSPSSFLPPIFTPNSSVTNNNFSMNQKETISSGTGNSPVPTFLSPHPPSSTQQQTSRLSPAQTLQRSPLDRRLASLVTVDILHTCSNLVKGIDHVMSRNHENKAKSTVKIGASVNNNTNAGGVDPFAASINSKNVQNVRNIHAENEKELLDKSSSNVVDPNKSASFFKPTSTTTNRIQTMTKQHRAGRTIQSAIAGSGGYSSKNSNGQVVGTSSLAVPTSDHASSMMDQEELDEELKRLRKMCHEDCYLEDDECSVYDGYGSDPFPVQLGPIASVVESVKDMVVDSNKVAESTEEMMTCLDECNSLRRDMIMMRKFKRNVMRANFHSRKLLQWANQCRTHMFIFNNTINQIGRDAAEDLRKGREKKKEQQERTSELILKLKETEDELVDVEKEVEALVVTHGDLEQKLLDTYKIRIEEKRNEEQQQQQMQQTAKKHSIAAAIMNASTSSPPVMRPKSPLVVENSKNTTDATVPTTPNANTTNNNSLSPSKLASPSSVGLIGLVGSPPPPNFTTTKNESGNNVLLSPPPQVSLQQQAMNSSTTSSTGAGAVSGIPGTPSSTTNQQTRQQQKKNSFQANLNSTINVFGNSVSSALNNTAGSSSSPQQIPPQQMSAAHRAFEKMSVSAVELYLLLHRYSMMLSMGSTPVNQNVQLAIKRVMMTIEQSIDVEKINLYGNACELYSI